MNSHPASLPTAGSVLCTADFDFPLPQHLIAQHPAPSRDQSRLLVLERAIGRLSHHPTFQDLLHYFRPGDVLVLNNSRVLPARLRGRKLPSGGEIEILLLKELPRNQWWTLLRPAKRVRPGTRIRFGASAGPEDLTASVIEKNSEGHCRLQFGGAVDVRHYLEVHGEIPLPPYIARKAEAADRERYQTVFAQHTGSVAAPTAGLHFTSALLDRIKRQGVQIEFVTLHIGLGTFAPVKVEDFAKHIMHEERFSLEPGVAGRINAARQAGRRILAVGTTTVRVLESIAAQNSGRLDGMEGRTRIFIHPPFRFHIVDGLLTNFHLPQSTLLMLVSAFAAPGETRGRDLVLAAYGEAVRENYRFFSYGDAMLIV